METFVQLIFVLALLKYCLKAALANHFWAIALYGVFAAIIGLMIYPFIIEQPANIGSILLMDRAVVANAAVITTIEAVSGIFISIFLLDNYFMRKQKRKRSIFLLKIAPGLLSLVAIAYFELMFFKWRVGADFTQTALLYSITIFTVIVTTATTLKFKLKGESLKLELKVLLNIGILIIGLFINASVADYNLSHANVEVEWGALASITVTFALLFVTGFYLSKINIKSLYKNSLKWNK